jgi:hypothetical protein
MTTMTHGGLSSSCHCRPHLLQEEGGHRHHTRKQVQATTPTRSLLLLSASKERTTRPVHFASFPYAFAQSHRSAGVSSLATQSQLDASRSVQTRTRVHTTFPLCVALRTFIHTVCFALRCWCDLLANAHASLGHAWPALSTLGQHWWAMASTGMSWLALVLLFGAATAEHNNSDYHVPSLLCPPLRCPPPAPSHSLLRSRRLRAYNARALYCPHSSSLLHRPLAHTLTHSHALLQAAP